MQDHDRSRLQRLSEWLLRHRHPLPIVVLGVALLLPSLTVGVQSDDIMIRAIVRGGRRDGVTRPAWQPFTFLTGKPEDSQLLMDTGWKRHVDRVNVSTREQGIVTCYGLALEQCRDS